MRNKEVVSELREWDKELGLSVANVDDLPSMDYVVKIGRIVADIDFSDFDEVIEKVSAYHSYLVAQKSSIESSLNLIKTDFNHRLHTATEKLLAQRKWRTFDERRAVAINMSSKLQSREAIVISLQAKFDKIKELPRAIEGRLLVLRRIYDRRVNEEKNGS